MKFFLPAHVFDAHDVYEYLSNPEESPDFWKQRPKNVTEVVQFITAKKSNGSKVYALHDNVVNRVVGLLTLSPINKEIYVMGIYVRKSSRKDVSLLVQQLFKNIKHDFFNQALTIRKILAITHENNLHCQSFLKRIGFQELGRKERAFGNDAGINFSLMLAA